MCLELPASNHTVDSAETDLDESGLTGSSNFDRDFGDFVETSSVSSTNPVHELDGDPFPPSALRLSPEGRSLLFRGC